VSTEVQKSTLVLLINVSAKNPAHRQYVNRNSAIRFASLRYFGPAASPQPLLQHYPENDFIK
ncbi:MAG TPA: hypothetical protein PKW69_15920, partial [Niabella sp.]|nr:hypothetical protein [Niabella sp.]